MERTSPVRDKKNAIHWQHRSKCKELSEGCKEKELNYSESLEPPSMQALQFIRTELLKTQKSISDLQTERRLLRKQLSRWTDAVQMLQETQENSHCRIEAHIHTLAVSSDCMRKQLKELRENVQGILYLKQKLDRRIPRFPNSVSWDDCSFNKTVVSIQNNKKSRQLNLEREHEHLKARNKQTLTHMRHLCESIKICTSYKENDTLGTQQCSRNDEMRSEKSSFSNKDTVNNHPTHGLQESSLKNEEDELVELIEKLKDALSLQIQPGHLPEVKQELLHTAGQVCRSYSDLISKVIEPTLK
ncbi:dystrotelin [Mantella aurantiaca]